MKSKLLSKISKLGAIKQAKTPSNVVAARPASRENKVTIYNLINKQGKIVSRNQSNKIMRA